MPPWIEIASSWAVGGVGAGGGFFAFKWFFEQIMGRMDKRADAIDAGTQALINHLGKEVTSLTGRIGQILARLDQVESELSECRKQHAEAHGEIARLTGLIQSRGEMRDTAATIVAAERLKDRAQ